MANLSFKFSSAPLRSIQEIQFGLLSPEEIKNMSVVSIEYPETMDEQGSRPRQMGLADPRLGSIDRAYKCATCDEGMSECPGHFGHIELAVPVFHVGRWIVMHERYLWHGVDLLLGFMTKIKKLLETVCHNCGKIKLDEVSHPCWMANLVLYELLMFSQYRAIPNLLTLFVFEIPRSVLTLYGATARSKWFVKLQ